MTPWFRIIRLHTRSILYRTKRVEREHLGKRAVMIFLYGTKEGQPCLGILNLLGGVHRRWFISCSMWDKICHLDEIQG